MSPSNGAAAGGGDFVEPSNDQVREALLRIGGMQHRRVFYERLENPLWVVPLDKAGAFGDAPALSIDESGYLRSRPWPEGDYLARMAAVVPEQVAAILLRYAETDNPYVQRVILAAAAQMPPAIAAPLVPHLDQHLRSPRRHLLDPHEVANLICALAEGGEADAALRLANGAYRPRSEGEPPGHAGPNVVAGLEDYWHRETLPNVVEALGGFGQKLLVTLKIWLEEFQRLSGSASEENLSDASYIWRPSVAPHEQNQGADNYGDALVEAVVQHTRSMVSGGAAVEGVVTELLDSKQPLLRRIAIHVLSTASPQAQPSRDFAASILLRPEFLGVDYRHEYAELARTFLPLLALEVTDRWTRLILEGPPLSEEELREEARRRETEGDVDEVIGRYRDVWQHSILSAVGASVLPREARDRLETLDAAHGPYPHADFPSYMTTGWVGRSSPITSEDLLEMDIDEVLTLLRTWTPPDDPFGESMEGLAKTLGEGVRSRPLEFSQRAPEFARTDPTYARAFARALQGAVEEGQPLDWEAVLRFGAEVVRETDDGSAPPATFDRDMVWRYAQRAVAGIIDEGVKAEGAASLPDALLPVALDVLEPLTHHADPTVEHDAEYGGSNMDPLTLSLNTTRPEALRTVAHIVRRTKVETRDERLEQVRQRALELLDGRFGRARDPSLAVAAVYGKSLASLAWVDPGWMRERIGRLRPDSEVSAERAYADVMLTTALAVYRPSMLLLDTVAPLVLPVLRRMSRGDPVTVGWRMRRGAGELLGDHLLTLLIRGTVTDSHPLVAAFFALAPVNDRASALGHLAWNLMHVDEVPDEVLARAKELWDARAAEVEAGQAEAQELTGFYWWVRSDKFDAEWWLPRLLVAAESTDFDPHGMVGEHVARAASHDPGLSLRVLSVLLRGRDEPFQRYDLVKHAPAVIAAALDTNDPTLDDMARSVMDQLGRGGHLRIAELVAQYRGSPSPGRRVDR